MRWIGVVLGLGFLVACSDDEGPGTANVAGTWSGEFTNDSAAVTSAVLVLEQDDDVVTGTLTLNTGLTATITNGQVGEETFTADLEINDLLCPGTIATSADLEGSQLVGTYEQTDCAGDTSGEYELARQ